MAGSGPPQRHFGSGIMDLPVSGGENMDAMKLATSMAAITSPITPDGLLSAQSLGAVSFCFPQTSMSTTFSTSQPGTHVTPSPLNMTLGFPMAMNPGGHQFVHPLSVGQICTTVGQSLGIPIGQTILAMPNITGSQGQFLSGPFGQLQPIIMGGQQTPVMANPFMGAPQNGSVTPLAASPNTFSLNNIAASALVHKDLIFENVAESGNESESNLSGETPKQEISDLADVESILNIVSMDDGGIPNDIEMPDSDESNSPSTKDDETTGNAVPPATPAVEYAASPKPSASPVPSESEKMEEEEDEDSQPAAMVTEDSQPVAMITEEEAIVEDGDSKEASPEEKPDEKPEKDDTVSPLAADDTKLGDEKPDSLDDVDDNAPFSVIDTADYNEDGIPVEYDQTEFNWEEYLQETGSSSVPPTAFTHVEYSLQSGFVKGMKLEVPNKPSSPTYWVASVVMSCGQLLRLRYDGYEDDGTADFWSDLMTAEIHPVGWCSANGRTLQPPDAIKDKFSDWKEFVVSSLTGARTAPSYLLDKTTGSTPIDQLKQGMKLEIQDAFNPTYVWIVQIVENVGGRLYLRYDGVDSGPHDFWMFYLDERLHPIGWAKEVSYTYKPPKEVEKSFANCSDDEIQKILADGLMTSQGQVLPADIFKDQPEIPLHKFQKGWKLEALNPETSNQIGPATIVKVFNNRYFLVEMDTLEKKPSHRVQFSCHANSPYIFPAHWCQCKGIRLTSPEGWWKVDFNWLEYLDYCDATSAPDFLFDLMTPAHEFEKGMKLEAVNPMNHNQICAATITKIVVGLMWIHLDVSAKMVASHVESVQSLKLFPVGWCESNGYQLKPPRKLGLKRPAPKRVAVVQPEMADPSWNDNRLDEYAQPKNGDSGSGWCPKIYFNHRCFSGPYLSKGRISELPKCVGPGPINLVMKEVLSMLINVAYKSCRVLREIQMEGSPNPAMHQQVLKAKYKGKSYRATVEICKSTAQLEEFCRQVCIKLECCPNLISQYLFNASCPENCSQLTKTKYTYYYGKKKKKVGRPPGGHTNLEDGPKKPGKRRKRKKINIVSKKTRMSIEDNDDDFEDDNDDDDSANSDGNDSSSNGLGCKRQGGNLKHLQSMRIKRKYTHHVPPPSDIRTRGAKLPKYSFERRTHKKIMLPSHHHHHHHHLHHHQPHHHGGSGHHAMVTKSQHTLGMSVKSAKHHVPRMKSHELSKVPKKEILKLDKNPLTWTLTDVVDFIKTTDCAHLARLFKDQEIDGQALLLLTLPTVQEHLELKLGPAIKLCHHIERVKIAFYSTFAK